MSIYSEFDVCSRSKDIDWCSPQLFRSFFAEGMMGGAEAEVQAKGAGRGGASVLSFEAAGCVSLDCHLTSLGHSRHICQNTN